MLLFYSIQHLQIDLKAPELQRLWVLPFEYHVKFHITTAQAHINHSKLNAGLATNDKCGSTKCKSMALTEA